MAELTAQVTFRVTQKMYERIKEIARNERRKPNEIARALLERGEAAYSSDQQLFEPENNRASKSQARTLKSYKRAEDKQKRA